MHLGIYIVTVNINSLLPQTSTTTSSHKEYASKAPITGARRGQNALPRAGKGSALKSESAH
jgi:hypothetical protein